MKKIVFLILIFLISCLSLNACSTDNKATPSLAENIEILTIYKMVSFSEVDEDSVMEITNPEDIKILEEAFRSAVKQDGSADMADPEYKIDFGEDVYYLWITETSGTIMNLIDTHTIYTLSEQSAQNVFEIVGRSYND
ncbi:hypothetical protein ACFVAD_18075 [Sutcliffiella sp. NPDC057660]|uniref:hypothetical protein n=1 Tax=Sutcliffiella sp. NPDC057660 TaxID=3346199 RepID=UPI0036824175